MLYLCSQLGKSLASVKLSRVAVRFMPAATFSFRTEDILWSYQLTLNRQALHPVAVRKAPPGLFEFTQAH